MESQMGYFSDGNEKEKDFICQFLSGDQTTNNKPEAVV